MLPVTILMNVLFGKCPFMSEDSPIVEHCLGVGYFLFQPHGHKMFVPTTLTPSA